MPLEPIRDEDVGPGAQQHLAIDGSQWHALEASASSPGEAQVEVQHGQTAILANLVEPDGDAEDRQARSEHVKLQPGEISEMLPRSSFANQAQWHMAVAHRALLSKEYSFTSRGSCFGLECQKPGAPQCERCFATFAISKVHSLAKADGGVPCCGGRRSATPRPAAAVAAQAGVPARGLCCPRVALALVVPG